MSWRHLCIALHAEDHKTPQEQSVRPAYLLRHSKRYSQTQQSKCKKILRIMGVGITRRASVSLWICWPVSFPWVVRVPRLALCWWQSSEMEVFSRTRSAKTIRRRVPLSGNPWISAAAWKPWLVSSVSMTGRGTTPQIRPTSGSCSRYTSGVRGKPERKWRLPKQKCAAGNCF